MTYHPLEAVRERVADLIQQSKNEELPAAETTALAYYRQREHLLHLAEARQRFAA